MPEIEADMHMKKVFISFSSYDFSEARAVRRLLEQHGATTVFLDAFDRNPAEDLMGVLSNQIKGADIFCLRLSPNALASQWVEKETAIALEERKRGLRFVPVHLRPCRFPDTLLGLQLQGVVAHRSYNGLESGYIRTQLLAALFEKNGTPNAVTLEEEFQKEEAEKAKQLAAARVLPELARKLNGPLRDTPIQSIQIVFDSMVFESSIDREDPFIVEVRLNLNDQFNTPMSFFFAPFQEGNTWPPPFTFTEPPYTSFHGDQPRVDGKMKWYDRVVQLGAHIDGTDLGNWPPIFSLKFDGSEFQPRYQDARRDKFHASIPPLRKRFQIPSLNTLISRTNAALT